MSDWSFVDSDPLWERLRKREKREEFRADLEATWWNPPILSMPNHPRYTSQGINAQLERDCDLRGRTKPRTPMKIGGPPPWLQSNGDRPVRPSNIWLGRKKPRTFMDVVEGIEVRDE